MEYLLVFLFGSCSLALVTQVHLLSLVILNCAMICEGFKTCFICQNSCNLVKAAVPDQNPFFWKTPVCVQLFLSSFISIVSKCKKLVG